MLGQWRMSMYEYRSDQQITKATNVRDEESRVSLRLREDHELLVVLGVLGLVEMMALKHKR